MIHWRYPFLGLFALALTLAGGCAGGPDAFNDGGKIQYPYQAPPERRAQIMKGVKALYLGMPESDVVKLLGEADERNVLYYNAEHFESHRSDGIVLVYLLQRIKPFGGMVERKEIAFRLEFSGDQRLRRVEAVEVPGMPAKFLPR